MSIDEVDFVRGHQRAVLVTHRRDGGLQSSPIRVLVDVEGRIVATTRATAAKCVNLLRDPRCALCVLSDAWQGPWLTIEAEAEVVALPEALEELRAFYLERDGRIEESASFEKLLRDEQRVIVHFQPKRSAGTAKT